MSVPFIEAGQGAGELEKERSTTLQGIVAGSQASRVNQLNRRGLAQCRGCEDPGGDEGVAVGAGEVGACNRGLAVIPLSSHHRQVHRATARRAPHVAGAKLQFFWQRLRL